MQTGRGTVTARVRGRGDGDLVSRDRVAVWDDDNVLETDGGDSCAT